MTAISLHIPDDLAQASHEAARSLGMSRTSFIRQAIEHELQQLTLKQERNAMLQSFITLYNDPAYLQEATEIEKLLNTNLPEEPEDWWKG